MFAAQNRGTSAGDMGNHTDVAARRRAPAKGRRKHSRGKLVRLQQTKATTYRAYMRSAAWRELRAAWWATYDKKYRVRRCYVCAITQAEYGRMGFDLHHVTYERLGHERFDDLTAVCRPCHEAITKAWRARHRTGLKMNLKELTDHYRRMARRKIAA